MTKIQKSQLHLCMQLHLISQLAAILYHISGGANESSQVVCPGCKSYCPGSDRQAVVISFCYARPVFRVSYYHLTSLVT